MDDPAPNNAALYRKFSQRVDRAVLRKAEVVSVTTTGTRNAYAQLFPESAAKIHVVPPLLSLPAEVIADAKQRDAAMPLRLVYVGTLYLGLRSPAPLLSLFKQLVAVLPHVPLELHFLGNVNDCAELFQPYCPWLDTRLFLHGVVSRERARKAMQAAHVLINLGNRSATQLPSKVIEYVAMGKPILNMITIPDDSSAGVLATYQAALTVQVNDAEMAEAGVRKVAEFILDPPVVMADALRDWLMPYTEQSVADDYLRLLHPQTIDTRNNFHITTQAGRK